MPIRWVRLLVLLIVVVSAAPACGDNPRSGREDPPKPQRTEEPTSTPAGSEGALADADCREYANSFSGVTPDPNNPESLANLTQIADSMERIAEKVPNEISDDFRVLASAYRQFAGGLGDLDLSDPSGSANVTPEELQRMREALKSLDQENVRAAAANISKFVKENCPSG